MKYLYQNKNWKMAKEYNLDKLLYLLIDRPNLIKNNGNFIWKNNIKQFHRDYDLPADIHYNKTVCNLCWFNQHKRHRGNNKPTIICYDGYKMYHINDKFIKRKWPR